MANVLNQCIVSTVLKVEQTDNGPQKPIIGGGSYGFDIRQFSVGSNTVNSVNEAFAPAAITLAGGASTTVNLLDTTQKNIANGALTLGRVKIVQVYVPYSANTVNGVLWNASSATSALDVGGTIKNGGFIYYCDPTANGNTVNTALKFIKLENKDATNTVTVNITVIGAQT